MVPVWLMLLALLSVFVENGMRTRRDRRALSRRTDQFATERDREFQRLHLLVDQLRDEHEPLRRDQAVRQVHAELTKVHRAVIHLVELE